MSLDVIVRVAGDSLGYELGYRRVRTQPVPVGVLRLFRDDVDDVSLRVCR
jgi:hypothetical protein